MMMKDNDRALWHSKTFQKYLELNGYVKTLQDILDDKNRLLSEEETQAVKAGLSALSEKSAFFSPDALKKRKAGIAKAKEEGKYKGRKPLFINEDLFNETYILYMHRDITKKEMATRLHVSRPTLDKIIKEKKDAHRK